jgi:8-oxo-dGTP diphosphatase
MKKIQHDSEVAAKGQQVFTACAFIYKETEEGIKLFSPKRAATKKFLPGVHELPGGHIDFGEGMREGLKREIMEEFGVRIEIGECFGVFTYMNEIKGSQSLEAVYFAKLIDPEELICLNAEDHESFLWLKEDELDKIMNKNKTENDLEIKVIKKGFAILKKKFNWDISKS